MKDIRFRAWDKIEKRMWWNVQEAYDTLHSHHTPDPDVDSSALEDQFMPCSFGAVIDDDNYILMMWTGLYDKDKQPIWEGDVVEYTIEGYKQAKPYVVESMIDLHLALNEGDGYYRFDEHSLSVIGNIYQHPHLLEEK